MLKLLFSCVLWTATCSETIEWFNGRWLPIVLYSNTIDNKTEEWVGWHGDGYTGLWTGWLLQSKEEPRQCGWLEFTHIPSQQCFCGDKNRTPAMQVTDLADLDTLEFYKFNYNESRPVIVVDSVDEVDAALTAKCTCDGKESTQLVFKKTSHNYLVAYENKDRTETGPNMTLVMTRYVPTMSELLKATHVTDELYSKSSVSDTPYQSATLMCDPTFFDDSAYVVGDDGDNSPFITLAFLKNDNDEQIKADELTTQVSEENEMSTQADAVVELLTETINDYIETENNAVEFTTPAPKQNKISTEANDAVVKSLTETENDYIENEDSDVESSKRSNNLLTTVRTETMSWYSGRWLPIVLYSNTMVNRSEDWIGWRGNGYIGLWTGWLLQSEFEPKECGWLEFAHNTSQRCTCGDRKDIPLVQITDLADLDTLTFYKFQYNESRPVVIVDNVDEVKAALSANCTCGNDKKTQLVFRKTSNDYLVSYENKEQTETGPNMTLVMVRYVPTMSELQLVTHSPSRFWDMPYQPATLMCDPTFFDDAAYVVGDDENNSPFLTLGDLKNDNEPRKNYESSPSRVEVDVGVESSTSRVEVDAGVESSISRVEVDAGVESSTSKVEVDADVESSTQATSKSVSSSGLWVFNTLQIAGRDWLMNRIE